MDKKEKTMPWGDNLIIRYGENGEMYIEDVSYEAINSMIKKCYREKDISCKEKNVIIYCEQANIVQECRCGCSPR